MITTTQFASAIFVVALLVSEVNEEGIFGKQAWKFEEVFSLSSSLLITIKLISSISWNKEKITLTLNTPFYLPC